MRCDPKKVKAFDYSELAEEFSVLPKPAQRALVNQNILTLKKLSRFTEREIEDLHGIGPSSVPKLRKLLKENNLSFKS